MKVKLKETTVTTLALNDEEAVLLVALSDFPSHEDQPPKIRKFLEALAEKLGDLGYCEDAESAGFVNKTSVS